MYHLYLTIKLNKPLKQMERRRKFIYTYIKITKLQPFRSTKCIHSVYFTEITPVIAVAPLLRALPCLHYHRLINYYTSS